ncbi:hypothetical protein B0H13DRAFT_2322945 [Mycena leptocephala]|nr:hypothetical protein B0H13DRAFT_2322945 [Mycena leptocephala]
MASRFSDHLTSVAASFASVLRPLHCGSLSDTEGHFRTLAAHLVQSSFSLQGMAAPIPVPTVPNSPAAALSKAGAAKFPAAPTPLQICTPAASKAPLKEPI